MAAAENEPISWRKGSRCAANGTCVEVGAVVGAIATRDAKFADQSPVLLFSSSEWRRFTDQVKSGDHDLAH